MRLNSTSLILFTRLLSLPLFSNPYFYLQEYHKKPIGFAVALSLICISPNNCPRYNITALKYFCC